jgi:hypothetical protein
MRVVSWDGARLSTKDSVELTTPVNGTALRDSYRETVRALTLGLVGFRGNTLVAGPLELLRFGQPKVTRKSVDWPIEGGLLAGRRGGHLRVEAAAGRVEATVTGYTPGLPRLVYSLTQLHVHLLFTRLYLLRLRGREPAPGVPAGPRHRLMAASVDLAFCLTLAGLTGSRRLRRALAITATYHVACWSISGRTLGGMVMRQRVVAVDGSRVTPTQSLLRFVLLPVSWIARRPVHDDIACTEVIRA